MFKFIITIIGVLLISNVAWSSVVKSKTDIYIAGFLPVDVEGQQSYKSIYAAVELAVDHINQSPHILKDYNLNVLWNDTQVSAKYYHSWFFLIKFLAF